MRIPNLFLVVTKYSRNWTTVINYLSSANYSHMSLFLTLSYDCIRSYSTSFTNVLKTTRVKVSFQTFFINFQPRIWFPASSGPGLFLIIIQNQEQLLKGEMFLINFKKSQGNTYDITYGITFGKIADYNLKLHRKRTLPNVSLWIFWKSDSVELLQKYTFVWCALAFVMVN